MNDFDFNPVEYADEVYGVLKSLSEDSLAFDLTIEALQKVLKKAEEEAAEERRAAAVSAAEEALQSGEVTWWYVSTPKIFQSFDFLFCELGFNDGEEVC